jgi:uncharacterized protein (TIGR03435 family)
VSTVKPSDPAQDSTSGIRTGHGRLDGENVTVKRCIIGAYEIGPHEVVGGPDWINTETFDISAKSDQLIDDDHVLDLMFQRLLADRFKLVLRTETRTTSAYVLEVEKKGAKVQRAHGGDAYTGLSSGGHGSNSLDARNTDMKLFARVLARKMDLPVVDESGLKGTFDFKLHWTSDAAIADNQGGRDSVSIFTALQEQLGLRLRSTKAPVQVLVVDHVERPTPD